MNIQLSKEIFELTYAMLGVFINEAKENLLPVLKEILPEEPEAYSIIKEVEDMVSEAHVLYQPYATYLSLQKHPEACIVLQNTTISVDIYTYRNLVSFKDKIALIFKRVKIIQNLIKNTGSEK